MYGMIHQAAREMIHDLHGPAVWADILRKSGLGDESFISAQHYSDEQTLSLINAISVSTGKDIDTVLEEFGGYWINFTEASSFAGIMRMAGDNLFSFIGNLDRLHASIKTSMNKAVTPSFEVIRSTETTVEVMYRSDRTGLAPFVRGLFYGLLAHFGETGTVTHVDQEDGCLFTIDLQPDPAA